MYCQQYNVYVIHYVNSTMLYVIHYVNQQYNVYVCM